MCTQLQNGVTLIEMAVTALVLSILIATAQPLLAEQIETRRVAGAAEIIRSHLQFARTEATAQGKDMVVTYGMDGKVEWRIGIRDDSQCDTALGDPDAPDACSIPGTAGRQLTRLDGSDFRGVSARASRAATRFDAIHGLSLGGNVTITLIGATGKEARVIVSNHGRIRTCSPGGSQKVGDFPAC